MNFTSEKSNMFRNGSEPAKSTIFSNPSVPNSVVCGNNVSKGRGQRRSRKNRENIYKKVSCKNSKITPNADSNKLFNTNFYGGELDTQSNRYTKNIFEISPPSNVTEKNVFNTSSKRVNTDNEMSKCTSQNGGLNGTKNVAVLTEEKTCLEVDQAPECHDKNIMEKNIEISPESKDNSLEVPKNDSISNDIKLKKHRQPVKGFIFSNLLKDVRKVTDKDELSKSISEKMIINVINNEVAEVDKDNCMNINQMPKDYIKMKTEGKLIESLPESTNSSVDNPTKCSSNISKDVRKLKKPRQPFKKFVSSNLCKSDFVLAENTATGSMFSGGTCSSMDISNEDSLSIACNSSSPKTSNIKQDHNFQAGAVPCLDDVSSFNENNEILQSSNMPLPSCNDLKNDTVYQTYISNLINEYLLLDEAVPSSSKNEDRHHNSVPNPSVVQTTKNEHQFVCNWCEVFDIKGIECMNPIFGIKNKHPNVLALIRMSVPYQSLVSSWKLYDKMEEKFNTVTSNSSESFSCLKTNPHSQNMAASEEVN